MIFFLNRGLILEQIIVKVLQDYLNTAGVREFYKGQTITVSNKHPFARLLLNSLSGTKPDSSLFPSITVASLEDGKPGELDQLIDTSAIEIVPEDVNAPEPGAKSPLEARGYMMMTPEKYEAIRAAVEANGHVFGVSNSIRRQDRIAIEIWAENIQIKNELYELIRLFVAGYMKEALEKQYEEYGLAIFDNTIRGQRSNNFNGEFGIELWGAWLAFEVDYIIEQTVIDTELVDSEIDFMEVINHVKGEAGSSRSIIIGEPDRAEPGSE